MMKKKTYFLIAAIILSGFATYLSNAYADSVLFVAPTRVNLNERHKVEVMNLSNQSDVARHYKISVEEMAMNEEGLTNFSPNFPYSAKKMIKFYPREITIQPGERQAVRVMAKIPADTPDGQYHAHIKFFEDGKVSSYKKAPSTNLPEIPDKSGARAGVAYSALLPVIVSKGNIDTKINWVDPKLTYDAQNKIYKIDMQLTRSGNGQGTAFFDIALVSSDGREKQIGKRRTVHIYREIDKRKANVAFVMPEGASVAGGKIKLRLSSSIGGGKPVPVTETLLPIP